jgi:membrane protease YdiL (CAAX protease family)
MLVSSVAVLIIAALALEGPELLQNPGGFQRFIAEIASGPMGILILIAPGQIFFLGLAIAAALPSPDPLAKRLGMLRPRGSTRTWVLLALGTPAIQLAGISLGSALFDMSEPSEHLQMIAALITDQEGFLAVSLLILFASIFPGFSEELFFRGYLRVGLERRWGFKVAIFLPALIFAAVHMDPMHATVILPLGLWFGWLAHKSRSTIPSIAAHLINNLFAILLARQTADLAPALAELSEATATAAEGTTELSAEAVAATELGTLALVAYGISVLFLIAGIRSLRRSPPHEPNSSDNTG